MAEDNNGNNTPAIKHPMRQGGIRRLLRDFLPYLTGDADTKKRIGATVVFTLMEKGAEASIPLIFGAAVSIISGGEWTPYILVAVLAGYVLVMLTEQISEELKYCIFARVAQRAVRTLAVRVFDHLHRLSLRFHLNRQTGGLSRVIERGTKSIEFMLTFMLLSTVPTMLAIVIAFVILWAVFDFRYAAVLLITMVGYFVYTLAVTEWRLHFRRRMNDCDKTANTLMVDSLLNHETVKNFNARRMETLRYDKLMHNYEDAAVKNRTSLSVLNVGQGLIMAAGLLAVMLMAGDDVQNGKMDVGGFVTIHTYFFQLYLPLDFLGTIYREIRQALTDMEEMFVLLDEPLDVEDAPDAAPLKINGGGIVFNNVRFAYDDKRGDILHGVSFGAERGKKTAIVGPSGSGKSTIGRLLSRFYDPGGGTIRIDGQDIRKCKQESVRDAIGIVPQDAVLFNDTIGHNIGYGKENATEDQIRRAAKLAAIDKFIESLPEGYETIVGERGLKLSGGEKQRIAIARAIIKDPAVFLFDEATSALDSQTEKSIQKDLGILASTRTTVMIAHRLSTIADADEIIVLVKGKIAERGKHAELMAKNGTYAAMWKLQQKEQQTRE